MSGYGVRLAMYSKESILLVISHLLNIHAVGMGVMLATIWIRLPQIDSRINDRLGVHFYSVAFLAFMSVAGIPSFVRSPSFLSSVVCILNVISSEA